MDDRYKKLQRFSQVGARGCGNKRSRVAWGCRECVMAGMRWWTIRDGRARGCIVLDLYSLDVGEIKSVVMDD